MKIFDSGASLPDPESFGEYKLSYRTGDIVSPRIDATEPLSLELADFAAAIREGAPLASSAEVGLDVVRTVEAVDRSLAEDGAPVVIEAEGPLLESLSDRVEELVSLQEEGTVESTTPDNIGTAIIGGGPAGLTAAYLLGSAGATLRSSSPTAPSAESPRRSSSTATASTSAATASSPSSVRSSGCGRRCSARTSSTRPRLSRIYYNGQFFSYPLTARDVFEPLGILESTRCALSYLWAAGSHAAEAETFEEWVTSPLRPPPLRHVLPLLHGEGVGHPGLRDPRRSGPPSGSRTSRSARRSSRSWASGGST